MAYMNQEKKAKIAAELKKVIPRDWKWSLKVHHHSSIILTISAAPVDLFHLHAGNANWTDGYIQVNHYHLQHAYNGALLKTFEKIAKALNTDNHDNSDPMTDYFDVGHYVSLHIGRWDKPFVVLKGTPQPGSDEYESLKARVAQLESQTVKTGYVKRALKADGNGGLYLDCACGLKVFVSAHQADRYTCACGRQYDAQGWIVGQKATA